ncbi:MAG: L-serine ammonia-lyase, iron-sulfur-dependent, subunit alpha [Flavobacteriales bacterium]|nr:L-serine ammonia-lyase, iron-sulfur-dependent, subunit alpha [Flavobacteriales bacterium]
MSKYIYNNFRELLELLGSDQSVSNLVKIAHEREKVLNPLAFDGKDVSFLKEFVKQQIERALRNVNHYVESATDDELIGNYAVNLAKKYPSSLSSYVAAAMVALNDLHCGTDAICTSGSSGIYPAVWAKLSETDFDLERLIDCTIASYVFATIIEQNSSVSAAMGGCFAETGVTSAAAAVLVVLYNGGSFAQAIRACRLTWTRAEALKCETIGGKVTIPCVQLNVMATKNAFEMATKCLVEETILDIEIYELDRYMVKAWAIMRSMPLSNKERCSGAKCLSLGWQKMMGKGGYLLNSKNDVCPPNLGLTDIEIASNTLMPKAYFRERSMFDVCGGTTFGPSSSHSLAPTRIGTLISMLVSEKFILDELRLYNSFATTGIGHMTRESILCGLLNEPSYKIDLLRAFENAERQIEYSSEKVSYIEDSNYADNAVHVALTTTASRKPWTFYAESLGGGAFVITEVNGIKSELTGRFPIACIDGEYHEIKTMEGKKNYADQIVVSNNICF